MRRALSKKHMSDEEFKKHFTPKYNVWEQRVCMAPDGDFFRAIRSKRASIVTDQILCFDDRGIQLESGGHVDADLIVTATGLQLHSNPPMGALQVAIDGQPYVSTEHTMYKGCMLSDVPNFIFCRGYYQASWTLKVDITCKYMCRLLSHMRASGLAIAKPVLPADGVKAPPPSVVNSGYVLRSMHVNPKHGAEPPWAPLDSYQEDRVLMEMPVDDGVLAFSPAVDVAFPAAAEPTIWARL